MADGGLEPPSPMHLFVAFIRLVYYNLDIGFWGVVKCYTQG